MRSSAALLRPLLPSSASAAGSLAALWHGGMRSFNSGSSGDDFLESDAYSTNSFIPWLEEEVHLDTYARNLDGVTAPQVNEGARCVTKVLLSPRTTFWPLCCRCLADDNQLGIAKWVSVGLPQHMFLYGSVVQSNSYATSSRFEDKAKIRALMEARGLKKEPGWSRIEIQGQLNTFLVDDKSHPRNKEIREELQRMLELMKDAGYVADLRCVLRDIPESEKEYALQHHSERLAMALGHISLPPRAPMRIIKNLRVCNDCHVATKYFAYIYKREIIVRDATRFHHFRDGYCSCGDYW